METTSKGLVFQCWAIKHSLYFVIQARENKFTVRDFVYNPEELAAGKNELTKLATDKKKQFGPLVTKLKQILSFCRPQV